MICNTMGHLLARKIRGFLRLLRGKSRSSHPPPHQDLQDIIIPPQQVSQDIVIPALLNLPLDIIFEIFPLLPLPSQVCLALSCKPFYRLFSCTLQAGGLAWASMLACKTFRLSEDLLEPQPISPRTQLLLQLEDDYWAYCAECLKLQPRTVFWTGSKSRPPLSRMCILEAKVIDLCPCLSLTIFDRLRLERWLHTGLTETLSQRIRDAFQLMIIDGQPSLLHGCSIPNIPEVSADLAITVTFNENKQLEAQTLYHVRMSSYQPGPIVSPNCTMKPYSTERLYLCPHIDLLLFIYHSYYWPRYECWWCETSVFLVSCQEEGLYVVLQGIRNMGGPDWLEKCCLTSYAAARQNSHNITGAVGAWRSKGVPPLAVPLPSGRKQVDCNT